MTIKPTTRRSDPSLADTLNTGWVRFGSSGVATYASGTTFTLVGDQTAYFTVGRRLRIYHVTSAVYKYVMVVSSSYSSPTTTVTVVGDTLLNEVFSSIWTDLSPTSFAKVGNTNFNASDPLAAAKTAFGTYIPWTDWTPALYKNDGSTVVAGTIQTARYTQIAKLVRCVIGIHSVADPSGNNWFFTLPVTAKANANATILAVAYVGYTDGTHDQAGVVGIPASETAKAYVAFLQASAWAATNNKCYVGFVYEAA